ncbi:MAG TPA: ATP-binding protein [Thermoanaerobaculia bacterium]|nr:ATP-binding protein [Thermoanaerobaculia bacterium]
MLRFRKAQSRIAAVGTAVALLLLVLFALGTRIGVRAIMQDDIDDELETLSIAIASDLESGGASEITHDTLRKGVETNVLVYKLEHHSAVLFDAGGVVAASGDLAHAATHARLLAFAKRDERPFTAREPFTSHHRLCRFRVVHLQQGAAGLTLLIFRPIDAMARTLGTIDLALAVLVTAGSAVVSLILAFAVGRALRPVEELTSFAARVTATDLSQRAAVPAAGEEFSRLASVINSLMERLQQSFDAQRRFVADAAHELKTPTAVIVAEAQELRRGRLPPSEAQESVGTIAAAASGLAREVDDLLELARGDSTVRPRERFDLDDAVDEALAMAAALAEDREVRLRREGRCDATIDGDRAGIVRAVANLAMNAVRYGPRGGEVRVSVRVAGDVCEIDVADQGPGIPPEDRRRIFDRFVRLTPARREHPEGSGLGLAIVEQVVLAHGGSVEVLDCEGGGALFRVRLRR